MSRIDIIAFDPGEMTGWARGFVQDDELFVTMNGYNPWKQVLLAYANSQLDGLPNSYDHTVYESWRLRGDAAMSLIGSDLQSSQFIGGMKLVVWRLKQARVVAELFTNNPGNKNTIDAWMSRVNKDYLPSSPVDHNRDALRHLHYHAIKRLGVKEENCYYIEEAQYG